MCSTLAHWRDYALVLLVQTFMLVQVGVFYAYLRAKAYLRAMATPAFARRQPQANRRDCALRTISVVVPAFNESRSIRRCLQALADTLTLPADQLDVIVIDAGCRDATMATVAELAPTMPFAIRTTRSDGGRGRALNAGLREAKGDVLLVLHADTLLPASWDTAVLEALRSPSVLMTAFRFGCDRGGLERPAEPPAGLALMEWTVNLRSAWFELPFGDQALALAAHTLEAVGGYPDYCMLEEYELVCRLRERAATNGGRIVTLPLTALCSPRRQERLSVWRSNALNQAVMLWYRFGATPEQVFELYYQTTVKRQGERSLSESGASCGGGGGSSGGSGGNGGAHGADWHALSRCTNGERAEGWITVFQQTNSLFVHVPRCAGSSLEAALFGLKLYSQHYTLGELEAALGVQIGAGSGESSAETSRRMERPEPPPRAPPFRFSFVREPLDRYLSAFAYLSKRVEAVGWPAISRHDTLACEMLCTTPWADAPLAYLRYLSSLSSWESAPLHFRPQVAACSAILCSSPSASPSTSQPPSGSRCSLPTALLLAAALSGRPGGPAPPRLPRPLGGVAGRVRARARGARLWRPRHRARLAAAPPHELERG